MGNDLRKIPPADLAILSNPAVIAVNQDTTASSIVRRSLTYFPTNDTAALLNPQFPSSQPLLQFWSGPLTTTTNTTAGMDMVVLFINGLDTTTTMNATLADIFVDNGPGGTAPQIEMSWEIRDLWSPFNRMSDATAASIISGTSTGNMTVATTDTNGNNVTMEIPMFNITTEGSYGDAVAKANTSSVPGFMEMMLGSVVGVVEKGGEMSVGVEGHGVRLFRLRAVAEVGGRKRDEL